MLLCTTNAVNKKILTIPEFDRGRMKKKLRESPSNDFIVS